MRVNGTLKVLKNQKRKTARIEIGFEPSSPHTLPGNGSTGCYFDIIPGLKSLNI